MKTRFTAVLGWLSVPVLLAFCTPPLLAVSNPGLVPVLQTTFNNPTPAPSDEFSTALAALGSDRFIIGAPGDDTGETNTGAAYLFHVSGALLITFTNPAPAFSDRFGFSVAAVGNDRVLIGAPSAQDAGTAYLFSTNGILLTCFTNAAPVINDGFGTGVTGVGSDCVLIGAPTIIQRETGRSGAAYLFSASGELLTVFTNPTPNVDDDFGSSVREMGGDHVLIGAPTAPGKFGVPSAVGVAYLFSTNGILISTFHHPLTGEFPGNSQRFGTAMAPLGRDRVFIGAPRTDIDPTVFIYRSGATYLFNTNGVLLTTINNPTLNEGEFGQTVSTMGSDLLLVGAPGNGLSGAAYVYSTNGTLVSTIVKPTHVSGFGYLGNQVLTIGRDQVLVGAFRDDTGSMNTGAAYLFNLAPSLELRSASVNSLTVSWAAFGSDFSLRQNNGFATADWSNASEAIQNDGTNKFIIVDPTTGSRFFQLMKP